MGEDGKRIGLSRLGSADPGLLRVSAAGDRRVLQKGGEINNWTFFCPELTLRFGSLAAVDEVSFSVQQGEITFSNCLLELLLYDF